MGLSQERGGGGSLLYKAFVFNGSVMQTHAAVQELFYVLLMMHSMLCSHCDKMLYGTLLARQMSIPSKHNCMATSSLQV